MVNLWQCLFTATVVVTRQRSVSTKMRMYGSWRMTAATGRCFRQNISSPTTPTSAYRPRTSSSPSLPLDECWQLLDTVDHVVGRRFTVCCSEDVVVARQLIGFHPVNCLVTEQYPSEISRHPVLQHVVSTSVRCMYYPLYIGWAKKVNRILLSVSSPNIDRLSKNFSPTLFEVNL